MTMMERTLLDAPEPAALQLRGHGRFATLIDELRAEADASEDTAERAMLEAAAEVLAGLLRAFHHVTERTQPPLHGDDVPQPM